jgi:hypothetical protein
MQCLSVIPAPVTGDFLVLDKLETTIATIHNRVPTQPTITTNRPLTVPELRAIQALTRSSVVRG